MARQSRLTEWLQCRTLMAPPSRRTASTAGPAPAPPYTRDVRGKLLQSWRSRGWQRPRFRLGRQPGRPRRPPETLASSLGTGAGQGSRRPCPGRCACRPARMSGPKRVTRPTTWDRCCRTCKSSRSPRLPAGGWDQPYACPRRFAGPAARCCCGREGEQGGRQIPRSHPAQPYPRELLQTVPAKRLPGTQGRLP